MFDPMRIDRPDPTLMKYNWACSLLSGPFFLFAIIPLYLKYRTLRYRFDEEGISMSWGFLFRHEINLTYRRIQDIHLTRNIIQRWMGLSSVAVQTAAGSSGPEMTIEGILEAEQLRDFLYSKMRGAKDPAVQPATEESEPLVLLREIRDLLKARSSRKETV